MAHLTRLVERPLPGRGRRGGRTPRPEPLPRSRSGGLSGDAPRHGGRRLRPRGGGRRRSWRSSAPCGRGPISAPCRTCSYGRAPRSPSRSPAASRIRWTSARSTGRASQETLLGRTVQTRTARSCAYRCSFCDYPIRAGKLALAAVDIVERELAMLHARGVANVVFVDDTFNVPEERFRALCAMMIRRRFGFRWFLVSPLRVDQGGRHRRADARERVRRCLPRHRIGRSRRPRHHGQGLDGRAVPARGSRRCIATTS